MAKLERELNGNFDEITKLIKDGIVNGSISAELVDKSNFKGKNSRCSLLVFERYGFTGKNRVSLSVNLYQEKERIVYVSAISSGGSGAMLFKINTIPENSFLSKLEEVLDGID